MIITAAGPLLSTPSGDVRWASLSRRGMLWSEVQTFDVVTMNAGTRLPTDRQYLQLLYCVAGSAAVEAAEHGVIVVSAGECLVVERPDGVRVTAGIHGATLVRARLLPSHLARQLPPRKPSVDD